MPTTLCMIAALVMLAAVVVAKSVTMELLRAQRRRFERLQEHLERSQSELRRASGYRSMAERGRQSAERRRHRINVRIAHAHEEIGLHEYTEASRQAHFGLLTTHVVER